MLFRSAWALVALAMVSSTAAAQFTYSVTLSGAQENPPNSSIATGSATFTYDASTNLFTFTGSGLSYNNLNNGGGGGNFQPTLAHIHLAASFGANGPVIVDILTGAGVAPGFSQNTTPTGGNFTGSATLTETQEVGFLNGLAYFNVHSSTFPGGELRGNIAAVPEPASLVLASVGALGLGGLVYRRFRRQNQKPMHHGRLSK